jgi:Fe-S oxidoreductase
VDFTWIGLVGIEDPVRPTVKDAVDLCRKAGIEVIFPEDQTCCGTPARGSGAYDMAAQCAVENIKALLKEDVRYVVTACASCTSALKQEFLNVIESENMTEWIPRAKDSRRKHTTFLPREETRGRGAPGFS